MRSVAGSPGIIEATIDGSTEAGMFCRVTILHAVVGAVHAHHLCLEAADLVEPALLNSWSLNKREDGRRRGVELLRDVERGGHGFAPARSVTAWISRPPTPAIGAARTIIDGGPARDASKPRVGRHALLDRAHSRLRCNQPPGAFRPRSVPRSPSVAPSSARLAEHRGVPPHHRGTAGRGSPDAFSPVRVHRPGRAGQGGRARVAGGRPVDPARSLSVLWDRADNKAYEAHGRSG